jgi:acetyl esterase/lipase
MLGGDSAGGNLAVGVLSHLAHPHPAVEKLNISEPLGGLALIAPWTSLDYQPPENLDCRGDIITPYVAGPWSRAYLGHSNRDYYTDPSTAPSIWFRDFPVKKVLILAGQNEIMLRDIKGFAENFAVRPTPTAMTIWEVDILKAD